MGSAVPTWLAFRVLGFLLLGTLVVWIALETPGLTRTAPTALGLGSAFDSSTQIPKDRIDNTFQSANDRLAARNRSGNRLHTAGTIAGWLSFLCTSIITLVAGYQGVIVDTTKLDRTKLADLVKSHTTRFGRLVGLMAASAALCTALAARCNTDAEHAYRSADDLQKLMNTTRRTLLSATSVEDAQSALDDLRQAAQR